MRTFKFGIALGDTIKKTAYCLVVVILTSACNGRSPIAPDGTQQAGQAAVEFVAITGQVYANFDWGEPPVAEATILVREADSSQRTALTDDDGYYRVLVRPGPIAITASKSDYESKTLEFVLFKDTHLSFSLDHK